jgi:uncharacterized protein (TIRG00374 family)
VVSIAVLSTVIVRSHVSAVAHTLSNIRVSWLLLGLTVTAISSVLTATSWWWLLRGVGIRRNWLRCQQLELAGDVFDAALPTNVGGDLIRMAYAADSPAERPRTAAAVLLRRICNFPGMLTILAVGVVLTWGEADASRARPLAIVAIAVGGLALLVVFGPAPRILARSSRLANSRLGRPIREVLEAVSRVRKDPGVLAVSVSCGLGFFALVTLATWCYMRAIGIDPSLTYAAVVVTTVNLIALFPISVGGAGVREGGYATLLAVGTVGSAAQGTAVGICVTAQTLLFGVIGLPAYLAVRRARRARHDRPAPLAVDLSTTPEAAPSCV